MNLNFLRKLFCRKTFHLSSSGRTDTGKKRSRNEDSFCIIQKRNIYIVADGMGGHKAGNVASKEAVDILAQYLLDHKLYTLVNQEAIRHTMIAGFIHTNGKIMAMAAEKEQLRGMGCTLITCFIDNDHIHLCHVGDVRGYLAKADSFRQLTNDHSYAAQFEEINPTSVTTKACPPKNIVSRAIGFPFKEDPEYNFSKSQPGHRVIICSDGLWGMVGDSQLHDIILSSPSPEKACDSFIDKANEAGGKDNITVVSIYIN